MKKLQKTSLMTILFHSKKWRFRTLCFYQPSSPGAGIFTAYGSLMPKLVRVQMAGSPISPYWSRRALRALLQTQPKCLRHFGAFATPCTPRPEKAGAFSDHYVQGAFCPPLPEKASAFLSSYVQNAHIEPWPEKASAFSDPYEHASFCSSMRT